MWIAIRDVLLSSNVTLILCFICFILLVGIILSKTGLMQIHTSAVEIGAADRERNIIRQQTEYIKMHYEAMENTMDKPAGYDSWRGKCIMQAVCCEFIDWITLNHLTTAPAFVEIKQDRVVAIIHGLAEKQEFTNPEFDEFVRQDVKECIGKLVQIRNYYKKGGL